MESLMRNRELTETRMMQVCRYLFTTYFGYYLLCFASPEHLYSLRFSDCVGKLFVQALREELGAAERRAEEERAAHNATKKVCN